MPNEYTHYACKCKKTISEKSKKKGRENKPDLSTLKKEKL
jgi:hypothetical protein